MNYSDKAFKKTALNIGTVLIVFLVIFNIFSNISSAVEDILKEFFDSDVALAISSIIESVFYFLAFWIPCLIYKSIRNEKAPADSFSVSRVKGSAAIIVASISIILCSAYINAVIVSFFNFSEFTEEVLGDRQYMSPLAIIAAIISTAIVPAICEELLFRRTVLRALLPYGKTFAIMSSAVLFGLMHQNPAQIFYATAAGIVLGYAYVKTRSLLCVILIHFFNNLFSVIQQAMLSNLSEVLSFQLISILELILIAAGIMCAVFLLRAEKSKKSIYITGSFGVIFEDAPDYTEKKLSYSATKRFFLSPTVLIFSIICAIETSLLVFISLLWV